MRYDLITLSREFGAGARELAALLGDALGWRVLDADIALNVANRLGLERSSLAQWDEHAPTLLETLGSSMLIGTPELPITAAMAARPAALDVAAATRAVLEEAAAAPPVIIVGHGAQAIFAQRPRTLRIRLVAPLADRSRRIARRQGLSEKDATELARHFDRDRAHYVKEFIGRDVSDPLLYTLQVNTAEVSLPEIVPIVQLMLAERTS